MIIVHQQLVEKLCCVSSHSNYSNIFDHPCLLLCMKLVSFKIAAGLQAIGVVCDQFCVTILCS